MTSAPKGIIGPSNLRAEAHFERSESCGEDFCDAVEEAEALLGFDLPFDVESRLHESTTGALFNFAHSSFCDSVGLRSVGCGGVAGVSFVSETLFKLL